ncbi:alpha/beta fold hydrolase [Tessaracoccus antarcticus]|uniref:Alpha/beta fold hydrolase n=1 Tax=Tessaracoccus antarcticus TaxID=2479848 RepID=A0A3M0GLG7_9ACTN|nr:alpha/beta fold hydrolase [Tessaracoccus antarcticus]RMB62009.1 alpha/beta fold hydrolase [Tessaracoccus antarcticus]
MVSFPGPLPGLDPAWSRHVTATDADGVERRWHVLDTAADHAEGDPAFLGTMLCVHGNPTWSYVWRRFLSAARPGWRVIAVDQLGMGFSEDPRGSLAHPRTLAQRVEDLSRLTDALQLSGPVVAVGHDWGGIIASGWALRHRDQLAGLVLANTSVHHDFSSGLPTPLRPARALADLTCVRTPLFVRAATALSRPRLPRDVRDAFAAPYRYPADRRFVGQFVADIPAEPTHPSRPALEHIARGLTSLDVPVLLLRGPADPVFSEAHLRDLHARMPHADIHRYEGAGHLVTEDAPRTANDTWAWIAARVEDGEPSSGADTHRTPAEHGPAWSALLQRVRDTPDDLAVAQVADGRRMTFSELEADVAAVAAGLAAGGVTPGQRVALLVPPGIDLTVALYACWRVGAVVVVADAGLGLAGMRRALRGAGIDHVIGIAKGLAAVALLGVPGRRILVEGHSSAIGALVRRPHGYGPVRVAETLDDVRRRGGHAPAPALPAFDAEAAVLFTSGATGPAKGVLYRSDQIRAQAGHIKVLYGLTPADSFVAAFAPFALYGPAMGVGSVVPDMDVTAPSTLTAAGLADAIAAADATTVFASPASLRNVVATASALDAAQRASLARVRVAMSAGAPIPVSLLRKVQTVLPNAELHTPYGMTECLAVSDIDLAGLERAGTGNGVCVGTPLTGVEVSIAPLPRDPAEPDGLPTTAPDVTGEIIVRAAHVKDHYDQLWATQHASARDGGSHRTGDVGHLDPEGRLWVEGRRQHVIHTADGPLTPVALELAVLELSGVANAAAVGVGPVGTQALVVVVDTEASGPVLVGADLTAAVRESAAAVTRVPVAAVLRTSAFPVDVRHQSKVDRARLAHWAERVLSGGRVGAP